MEKSILTSTKKILGVAEDYTEFDIDIITHINSTLSTMNQIGIGPEECFAIEDKEAKWDDLELPQNQMNLARTYVYLKTRLLFDPPTTSFLLDAMNKVIQEQEHRLTFSKELSTLNNS